MGVQVIGVSFDSPENNALFKTNESFDFPLWSDEEHSLADQYDAVGLLGFVADRITVILDAEANWVLHYPKDVVSGGSLYNHAQVVLDDLATLFDATPD